MSDSKDSKGKAAFDSQEGNPEVLSIPHNRAFIPHLRSDAPVNHSAPHSLAEFREAEGRDNRKRRLIQLWKSLPEVVQSNVPHKHPIDDGTGGHITLEKAESLKAMYDHELLLHCKIPASGSRPPHIGWREFKNYAEAKEVELWHIFHDELDLDENGRLDQKELHSALSKAGIELMPSTISEFILSLSTEPHSQHINFDEFRDFFILLPRKVSPAEIYRYYEVKKYMGEDGRGAARVNMEGDVSLSAEDKPPDPGTYKMISSGSSPSVSNVLEPDEDFDEEEEEEDHHHFLEGHTALKFLLAGGIAGAVSRTCTAPFDRLKIFLITRPPELGGPSLTDKKVSGVKVIGSAVARIYSEGGVMAFWTGNGLSVAKIFPESAIKFFAYESSKRAFAKYWDKVEDSRDISGISRFLSGGIGGISSQLSIYPIETLKTQMMSNTGEQKRTMAAAIRHLWGLGGVRAYYRGLTIGLVGVFPYSAIDMSTFEALKLAYQRSTGKEEPGVMALLAFGSVSGSVGATSVYPLNLVRTRLQASGSSGHPQTYTGVWDVAAKTWEREGWRGFYRGLFPTLAKVVPAVSISYVVYEHTKRRLGV
ncbi:mitochondrial carrier [Crassisporium funariophilum]|nr:mitochondrial carrier [Crassisporium funariophilum]